MIGVIGGNGVVATNRLCQMVEELDTKNGAFRDMHHPEMIVWQATQAPSRSMYLEGRGQSFIPDYVRIGKALKGLGCDTLCLCCNTAHYAIDELEAQIGIPFINVIAETAKEVHRFGYKEVAVMCTDGCLKTDLYGRYFKKFAPEVKIIYPDESSQALVTKGICNSKNSQRYLDESDEENPTNIFSRICNVIISSNPNCDCIIGGCTDISNVFSPDRYKAVAYLDSLYVLAKRIFEKEGYKNNNNNEDAEIN